MAAGPAALAPVSPLTAFPGQQDCVEECLYRAWGGQWRDARECPTELQGKDREM